ncbi:putative enoyl-CoA hydratase [Compostibacillus humi]|uniref:Putative enoyl-CoA hydratase n=1 Tax=Compostibacillus humi TaxID=1245525 RepID=A0A8J2ZR69_9BACI|nr:enoyl-CoA hydratase [Compostibacillus humi]GGH72878.1 putative enoyl-CoA hydratase [Compostibacillus humi]
MTTVAYHLENNVAYVTIQSPPANALSTKIIQELGEILDRIEQEKAAKAIVLSGEGRFFSAGADIKEFVSLQESSDYRKLAENGQNLFLRLENFPVPVIAAIHGAALGGGLELAMACHIRIVTENAKLGLPELTLGIIPGFAGTQRLPRYVGKDKAYEMILTGNPITGKEAYHYGLATKVVEENELHNVAKAMAERIASMSKPAVQRVMRLVALTENEPIEKGMTEEAIAFSEVFGNEDAKEGVQAFLEKRKPVFQDK